MTVKFIVEHMDELGEWTILEYNHICEITSDEKVIFTNFTENFCHISNKHKPTCYDKSISDLKNELDWNGICLLDMKANDKLKCSDKNEIKYVLFGGILGDVPAADRTSKLRNLKFGVSRNLGNKQMTTNTAILVTHIVLNDMVELDQIPFIDDPEIVLKSEKETMILPFRFVSKYYYTKCEQDKTVPILPNKFKEYLATLGDEQIW
ncbi:SAM-dependent RNA methyltransferase, putative [Hepatocystis sp. ex Piliocolobus tephrosceles]|nr:SAM-dependent RNA methyltransferase, putative [Hepatocystis sp. ex Piliocolobus tephrosceles]